MIQVFITEVHFFPSDLTLFFTNLSHFLKKNLKGDPDFGGAGVKIEMSINVRSGQWFSPLLQIPFLPCFPHGDLT